MKILILTGDNEPGMFQVTDNHISKIKEVDPKALVTIPKNAGTEELEGKIKESEILIATNGIPKIDFSNFKKIKLIHLSSAGVDKLPEELKKSNIRITNSSGVHPIPISEHVLCFMLMFARQMHITYRNQVERKIWDRTVNRVFELHEKTICIVGFGRIGSQIAKTAKSNGMKVIAVKIEKTDEKYVDRVFTNKEIGQAFSLSDFIVNALPSTPTTFHFFDKEKFSKMKKNSYFINIGRGKTVNEKDLIEFLKTKKIAGAALDVFEEEPLPKASPLWNLENVILTPHLSGWTPYYMDRVIDIFCTNLKCLLAKKALPNEVDKNRGY